MKVLFIGSKSYDYMQDIVYSGLVKTLGIRNVIEANWNKKYHIPHKKYPKNLGYINASILKSIHISKSKFDAVIVAATKPDCFRGYLKIAPIIPVGVPVIWIDGGDREELGGDLARLGSPNLLNNARALRDFDLIFKREYKIGQIYADNVLPLTFGFNLSRLPKKLTSARKYDVAFWAGESHEIRTKALNLLHNQFDCAANGTSRGVSLSSFKRKGSFYLEELSACKINLSLRGGGFDTLRYWEIPAVGSMLLSEPADIVIENDFVNGKSAVFCDPSLDDMVDLCKFYLKDDAKRESIASNGKNHLREYHTDVKRAEFIIKQVNSLL